jgi:long-chain fatty acid transport protein
MKQTKHLLAVAVSMAIASPAAFATNGMNLEGYGPIATGMGGASMAYDNGTAGMMNNPATLGMMDDGSNRLDVALGNLGPNVNAKAPAAMGGANASSGGTSYMMPAVGWSKRNGQLTYGFGMFSQGGMGTEYSSGSWMAMGSGDDVRSELGVGRLMIPVAYNVDSKLTIGGSIDYVWGGLDMKMAMPVFSGGGPNPGSFGDFATTFGGSQVLGSVNMSGGLGTNFSALITNPNTAMIRLDFSDGSDFTQKANGSGMGGKIGLTYKATSQVTVGASYHLKTSMSDWKGSAAMTVTDAGTGTNVMPGKITVKDFQWPATLAAGIAYTPNDRWLVVGDVKLLKWSDVMKDFTMVFNPDSAPSEYAEIKFFQDWSDQTIISLGGAYKATNELTVRAGANMASNPIPDKYVHPLFPATIENHYTVGMGYTISPASNVNFAVVYAPEVSTTNSNTGVKVTHSQTNWQLMYSHSF